MTLFRPAVVIILALVALWLAACTPSEEAIQAGVEAALAATQTAMPTATKTPINTPEPTPTETVTPTSQPTATLTSTAAPTSTSTPKPTRIVTPTPFPIITPWPELIPLGRRCIDQVTYDSYIYALSMEDVIRKRTHVGWWIEVVGEEPELRLFFSYVGDDWLFIDEIIFNIDGQVKRIPVPYVKQDVGGGGLVNEYGSLALDLASDLEWTTDTNRAEKVVARLSGRDGDSDVELTDAEITTLRYSIVVYNALITGTLELDDIPEGCLS